MGSVVLALSSSHRGHLQPVYFVRQLLFVAKLLHVVMGIRACTVVHCVLATKNPTVMLIRDRLDWYKMFLFLPGPTSL